MATEQEGPRVVSASREIVAGPGPIFELIADPAAQPRWDGNDNLVGAPAGQRVRRTGDVFTMTLTRGGVRENHVVEFEEGRRIAWLPAEPGQEPPGHLWRWELEPAGAARTRVTHTYDWTRLTDEKRLPRGPGDHGRQAPGLARPARGPGGRILTAVVGMARLAKRIRRRRCRSCGGLGRERTDVACAPVRESPRPASEQLPHRIGAQPDGVGAHERQPLDEGVGERGRRSVGVAEPDCLGWRGHLADLDVAPERLGEDLLGDGERLVTGQHVLPALTALLGQRDGGNST